MKKRKPQELGSLMEILAVERGPQADFVLAVLCRRMEPGETITTNSGHTFSAEAVGDELTVGELAAWAESIYLNPRKDDKLFAENYMKFSALTCDAFSRDVDLAAMKRKIREALASYDGENPEAVHGYFFTSFSTEVLNANAVC